MQLNCWKVYLKNEVLIQSSNIHLELANLVACSEGYTVDTHLFQGDHEL